MTDELMTIAEVAAFLKQHYQTVRSKIIQGVIPACDLTPESKHRSWRVLRSELMKWIKSGQPGPEPEKPAPLPAAGYKMRYRET